jgi:hypothetical protein
MVAPWSRIDCASGVSTLMVGDGTTPTRTMATSKKSTGVRGKREMWIGEYECGIELRTRMRQMRARIGCQYSGMNETCDDKHIFLEENRNSKDIADTRRDFLFLFSCVRVSKTGMAICNSGAY